MTEYINKGALLNHIESEASIWGDDYDVLQILGDIEDCPPADVRPVVRGRWVNRTNDFWECSTCGKDVRMETDGIYNFDEDPLYCPYCGSYNGADMRGGDAE